MRRRLAARLCALLLAATALPAEAEDLAVIVHPSRTVRVDLEILTQIYLKQRRRWPNGDPIVPVNRESDSPVRARFTRAVLGLTTQQLTLYWNRFYFEGVQPPATLASDEAMKRFVASEPRALGYVLASAVDDSVRVALRISDGPPAHP